ncbi:MAG TPA: hypothetical protein VHB27_09970 [Rhodopila sp.]|uniref:hypothetical protein n=1 Tax=Rhodopila sp. TaxID=2480087 RepID=UPI002CBD8D27|nr:hypothetical protein [Rhodopila sp.]HVY15547.1 hypothetical protein [Rhodopila sp.]
MLVGRRPFEGSNQSAIMLAVLKGDFQPPTAYAPGLSPALDAVVLKAMATDPADRFASASAFAEALRIAVNDPAAAMPAPPVAIPDDDGTIIQPSARIRPAALDPLADRPGTPPPGAGPAAGASLTPPARPPAPVAPPGKSGLGMGPIIGIVVAVLAIAGGGAFFLLGGRNQAPAPVAATVTPPVTAPVAAPGATTGPGTRPEVAAPPAVPSETKTAQTPTAPLPSGNQAPAAPPSVAPPVASTEGTPSTTAPTTAPPATAPTGNVPTGNAPATTAPATTAATPPAKPSLRDVVAGIPCAAVYGEDTPARLALRGVAPPDSLGALRASYDDTPAQSRSFNVQPLPARPFYCQVIDTLRPVLPMLGERGGVTASLLASPTTHALRLVDNDPIDFDITGPDMPSVLQVDYIDSTGKVSHYMPRKAQPVLDARRLTANEHVRLFDFLPGPAFQVGPPAGTDMVVVIASSEPLQMQHSRDDNENVSVYVQELRAALDAARKRGIRISADIVPVVSVETGK